jgi:hypothetical protein
MTDYKIGYCKPPKRAQWKKGQSGNPAGRPRRPANVATLVSTLLGQRVVVRRGKTTKRMTRLEHLLHRLLEKAIAGDPRLMKMALDEARREEESRVTDEAPEALDAKDREVMRALVERFTRDAERRVAET